jgi:hypothetical protein
VLVYTVIGYINKEFIFSDDYYYSILGGQLSEERIAAVLKMQHKFQVVAYLVQPVLLLLKWLAIAGAIYTVLFLLDQNISFKSCFKIVVFAELVSIISALTKVFCFLIRKPDTLQDVQNFYPLSLLQLLNIKQLPSYLIYPLQQFNLFEMAYWLLIAAGISVHMRKPLTKGLALTASSYGLALGIWVLCVVFIQLQFS